MALPPSQNLNIQTWGNQVWKNYFSVIRIIAPLLRMVWVLRASFVMKIPNDFKNTWRKICLWKIWTNFLSTVKEYFPYPFPCLLLALRSRCSWVHTMVHNLKKYINYISLWLKWNCLLFFIFPWFYLACSILRWKYNKIVIIYYMMNSR